MSFFSKQLGIDIGTANTRIYKHGCGIVVSEPSIAAIDKFSGRILATGSEASNITEKKPDCTIAIKPIKDGVIADFDITRAMLRHFIYRASAGVIIKPNLYVAVHGEITDVEKKAAKEAAIAAGAKSVSFVDASVASAFGAGMDANGADGNMIVDIGSGITDIAVVSFGETVASKSVRIAGNSFNDAIVNYIKNNFGVLIGEKMAEQVKLAICDSQSNEALVVGGRDISTGLPKQETINLSCVFEALYAGMNQIADSIKAVIERTPPELVDDISENGIALTGGSAGISGICEYLQTKTGIKTYIADNFADCVISGVGMIMEKKH